MIRRNLPLGDAPREWLLISQIEHARISQVLAEHWGSDDVPPVVCSPSERDPVLLQVRREVLAGIGRHDDGWANWEAAQAIDLAHGRPYDFMELPQADALGIWDASISTARREGLLAGAMTAGHFLALLASSHHKLSRQAIWWREKMESCRVRWLREWHEQVPNLHSKQLADQALRWLQLFDWLSLWLCCKCPALPDDAPSWPATLELAAPNQVDCPIIFDCVAIGGDRMIAVEPWPFALREFAVTASCAAVPVAKYGSTDELMHQRRRAELRWRFRYAGSSL
jgi:hypothetical protein